MTSSPFVNPACSVAGAPPFHQTDCLANAGGERNYTPSIDKVKPYWPELHI